MVQDVPPVERVTFKTEPQEFGLKPSAIQLPLKVNVRPGTE